MPDDPSPPNPTAGGPDGGPAVSDPAPPDTAWMAPDPPPIPDRIRRGVDPRRPRLPLPPRSAWTRVRPRASWWKAGVWSGGAAMVVGVASLVWPSGSFDAESQARWEQLCLDHAGWFGTLRDNLDHADVLTLREFGFDGVLADLDAADAYDPRTIAGQPDAPWPRLIETPPPVVRSEEGLEATRRAAAAVTRVEAALRRWPVRESLREHEALLNDHGWDRAARPIRRVLAHAPPEGGAPVGPSLREMERLEAVTAGVAQAVASLEHDLGVLAAHGDDPVLAAFAEAVRALDHRPPGEPKDDDAARLMKLRDRLEMLSAYGRRLAERVETGRYATLHLPAFRERGQAYAMLADGGRGAVDVADVARVWLDEAERFRQVDADWRPAWAARQHGKLAQADRDLEPVRTADHPSARAFGEKSQALAEQVEALLDADMVAGATGALDIRRVDVEREVDEFAAAAARLGQRLAAEALADSWRQDEPLVDPAAAHASATTQAFWARERRRMADYLERSGSIDEARSRLADTRRGLRAMTDPASPTGLPAADLGTPEAVGEPTRRLLTALDEEASRRREETLAQALSSGLPADEAAWAGLRAGFAQQLDDAREIARDALDAERMVRGAWPTGDASLKRRGESPAARVAAWAGSSWASAPAVAQAMGPIAARVDTLRQVEQLVSWSTLARLAQESRDPAVAFAAWRRMAADDSRVEVQEVPWPGTAESLATERLIQSRLLAMAGGVADPERAAALRAEVSGPASAERWRRAMVAAMANQDAAAIGAVAAWAGPMGVEVDTLPAGIRFNVLLSRARQAIAGLEPSGQRGAEVLAVSRAFVREARGLTPDGRADAALERLTALTRPGVKDEQDLASVGPASAGWTAQRSADGRSVTFRRGAWAMTFVRVGREGVQEAEAGGVHYVATTELPVGLALDAVAWAGADAAALWAAMHPAARGGDDMRKGPRTWVKASGIGMTDEQRALRPVTVNSGGWLASPAGGYPAGLTPTPPRATHPINYVSAEGASLLAAALGCRLPTASEWSMSLRLYPPEAERPPNLRDTTWARHARYVAALIAAGTPGVDWADRDVFRPDGQTPRPPTTADHHPFNDGTLWPRPTPTPPPPTPVDLVGNVAELVTDEPIDPSPLLDASRPAAQRRDTFRRAHAEAFAVVGGSALSPASQRPDEAGPFNVYAGARGYADVGLRLAFTAPLTTAAERAERALTGLPFRTQP